jgi:hypothetical protein
MSEHWWVELPTGYCRADYWSWREEAIERLK